MNALKRFLASPVFADDVEKTRVAGTLNAILLVVIGGSFLMMPISFSIRYPWAGLTIAALMSIASWIAWALLRAGHVYTVVRFFEISLWLSVTATVILFGGLTSSETMGYIVVVIVAGMLSGPRVMLLFAGLSVVGIVGIFVLELVGKLPPPLLTPGPVGGMALAILNLLTISIFFYWALSNTRQSLAAARRSSQALSDRNRELEIIRASLEDQVATRTQVAEKARLDAERANTALSAQMWQVAGLAQLGDVMRGVEDVPALAQAVLEHLCRYLEAQAGALYVSEANWFILAGTYACSLGAAHSLKFALGEGMVGQVAMEGLPHKLSGGARPFVLQSSFGEIALAQVILSPFLYAGAAVGVLELGRMTPFTEAQEQFLTQALDRLAVVIHAVQAHTQINALLQETQQQAVELRVQEEELRTANEELSAQAESLRDQP